MSPRMTRLCVLACGAGALALHAGPPAPPAAGPKGAAAKTPAGERVTEAEARARAKLMHEIYSNTLVVTHHYYFRHEGKTLPAVLFGHRDGQP